MSIMLGNLSVEQMETRAGVAFPPELKAYMADRRQEIADNIAPGKWHCFDLPFALVCGDMTTVMEVHKWLAPLSPEFKQDLNIYSAT